ncbi:MAG: hypothetical protein EOO76_15785 [Novosphingobium sp.]|nr:MAG: hypothetical protein EOO76_15785 [Novosphingobium sp.]
MSGDRAFRDVGPEEYRWHTELQGDALKIVELLWIDGQFDNGWQIGIGLLRARPLAGGNPAITIKLMSPAGTVSEVNHTFRPDEFHDDGGLSARWGTDNAVVGHRDENGRLAGYSLRLNVEGLRISLDAETVCAGVKFVDRSPGYTVHEPGSGLAVGWWPLVPRATCTGTIDQAGSPITVNGLVYLERQVSSFPLGGKVGERTAQSIWTWGHVFAGDYTIGWTDSGASEDFGFRHFTPFVMWKGHDPFFWTFAFASYVERFAINPENGLAYPAIVTLKAAMPEVDMFVRLENGRFSEHCVFNNMPGSLYSRQVCNAQVQFRRWGRTHRIAGHGVFEWGSAAGNFPFAQETQHGR